MTHENEKRSESVPNKLDTVKEFLPSAWCRETASPFCQPAWSDRFPSLGQCAVTAVLVQDLFGGELIRTEVEGFGSHYYNRLADGMVLDLTEGQFPAGTVVPPGKVVVRDYVLRSERAIAAKTEERYKLLMRRLTDVALRKCR